MGAAFRRVNSANLTSVDLFLVIVGSSRHKCDLNLSAEGQDAGFSGKLLLNVAANQNQPVFVLRNDGHLEVMETPPHTLLVHH